MKVTILIPVFNEQATISELIAKVAQAKLPPGFTKEVIIINDGSTDATPRILNKIKSGFKIIHQPRNLGKGAGIRTGIRHATGDIVIIQDADLEYNPNDFSRLLSLFKDKRVKAVYGSRFINYPLILTGKNKTPLPVHWLANKFLTFLTNILYGNSVTDMETCYKIVRRRTLLSLNLQSNRFDIEPEITAKLFKKGIKIKELAIQVKPRSYQEGKKIGWKDGLMAVVTLVKYRFLQ